LCAKIKNGLPSKYVINEVCALVCYQGQWVTKLGQDIFVNKFGNNCHHNVGPQGLHFDPFSGIVNKHKDIFVIGMPRVSHTDTTMCDSVNLKIVSKIFECGKTIKDF
jgi:hypothetical protein